MSVSEQLKEVWPKMRPVFRIFVFLLSMILIAVNVAVFLTQRPELPLVVTILMNFFLFIVILIVSFFIAARAVGDELTRKRNAEYQVREEAKEVARLAKLRKSMTDAEWAIYEVQLKNQELLREIKNKKTPQNNSTQFVRGITYEVGGED
jgi:hypothetical protein